MTSKSAEPLIYKLRPLSDVPGVMPNVKDKLSAIMQRYINHMNYSSKDRKLNEIRKRKRKGN